MYIRFVSIFSFLCVNCVFASDATKANDNKMEKPLGVIVQTVKVQELQNTIEALGSLRANEAAVITAKSTKTISEIFFEDGQQVNKNDVLVQMMNSEESALMQEAKFTAEESQKQLIRTKDLANKGAVSQSLLDQRTREYDTALARYQALASRNRELILVAPFSGTVGIREVSKGSLVSAGREITTLIDDSKMKLDFNVPVVYLTKVKKGIEIDAKSSDLGGKVFSGQIDSIDNHVDDVTRSFKVRALLNNPNRELKQGMLLTVYIKAEPRKAIVVNEETLVPVGSNNFVFVARETHGAAGASYKAEKQQIKIGRRYSGFVEVLSGLNEGEKVVTHGLQKIHAGQPLQIMAEQNDLSSQKQEVLSDLLSKTKGAN